MDVEGLEIDNDDTLPPLAFRIKTRQRVLDLVARDEDEKEDWISAIKAAVDDLHDRRGRNLTCNLPAMFKYLNLHMLIYLRDRLHISLLILGEFKRINFYFS